MDSIIKDTPVRLRHPSVFEPATLILLTVLCVLGAIIGMQMLVTLGVTANTSIVGALIAMALARIPGQLFGRFRSIHVQNLAQSAISAATFGAGNSLLLPIGIPFLLGRSDLVLPLLGGVALAMLVDATMLYRMFGSRAFPAEGAWPPGVAAAEAIRAGDEGGKRVGILGAGVVAGVVGTGLLGIPMSAFGVAFIGNIFALSMFGIGLLVRGYSPQLFSTWLPRGDIGAAFIPHGIMIGAGMVALVQVATVLLARRDADAPAQAGPGRALGVGSLAYIAIAVLIALGGGLSSELSTGMLVLFIVYAAFAALVHELIVGLAAMHSGWFPAFAVALITLILGMLIGFPPVSLALLVGFSAATGPAFADMGYDLKAGFMLRGHGADPAFEMEGRFQQYLAAMFVFVVAGVRRAGVLQGLFRCQPGGAGGQGLCRHHQGGRGTRRRLAVAGLGCSGCHLAAGRRPEAADGRAVRDRHADRVSRRRLGRAGGCRPAADLQPPAWPGGPGGDGSVCRRGDRR